MYVFDAQGKLVYNADHYFNQPGMQFIGWDGMGHDGRLIVAGTYFVEIVVGTKVFRKTIVRS
ncbi:MAG TPA: FlgD immunoglobulin-like domain containing protein, partial [Saprospiraceae bacterium]|nr:FlgD immunoglobulin-like domain containing protein [Saprospiraceae bacterium]